MWQKNYWQKNLQYIQFLQFQVEGAKEIESLEELKKVKLDLVITLGWRWNNTSSI